MKAGVQKPLKNVRVRIFRTLINGHRLIPFLLIRTILISTIMEFFFIITTIYTLSSMQMLNSKVWIMLRKNYLILLKIILSEAFLQVIIWSLPVTLRVNI